jgi:hypothetical protein
MNSPDRTGRGFSLIVTPEKTPKVVEAPGNVNRGMLFNLFLYAMNLRKFFQGGKA